MLTREKFLNILAVHVSLSLSVGVKQEDHDALLVEVQRLEAELGKVRQDLQGVVGCKGKCEQLDTLQETVSNSVTSALTSKSNRHFCVNEFLRIPPPDFSPGVLPSVVPGAKGVAGPVLRQWWLRRTPRVSGPLAVRALRWHT